MQTFTGTEYLKIDIANCFGLDRVSWADRMHWVDNNEPDLEAQAPQAKNQVLYRKAVRALRTTQQGKPTNHIMGLDATASGLQIMGALSGCHETAKAVNLIDTGVRQDVYGTVATHMNTLPNVNVDRDVIKKPVMTVFYGSTAQPKNILGEGPALIAFYQTLQEKLTGAYDLMGVLQSYWQPMAQYHQWTLPDGHVARVPVTQTEEKNLEIDELDHLKFAYRAKIISPKIQSRSLAANIVHSIDGWIVRQLVLKARKDGYWLAPIHDCFYTSPNNMDQVRANYLKIMQWLARSDLIARILTEISGKQVVYYKQDYNLDKYMVNAEYALS